MATTGINGGFTRIIYAAFLAIATLVTAGCGDIYERADFTTLVMGKSDRDVTKNVGKPAAVDSSNPERVTWTYNSVTFNLANNNSRDSKTIVVFKRDAGGKLTAAEVKFE
ncbi:MAG: hypothetical protein HY525_05695 [Betaproteobacteria bacterium]|nr:hypothetical protein [Betaproteobacteria bacterium]